MKNIILLLFLLLNCLTIQQMYAQEQASPSDNGHAAPLDEDVVDGEFTEA